jgi:hypothetical protein
MFKEKTFNSEKSDYGHIYPFLEYMSKQNRIIIYSYSKSVEGLQIKKIENDFKHFITNSGSSPKAANEIWKWYDPSQKKGATSS